MGIKTVQDTSLTSVADAIRVKAEISGTLEFPDGFVSAIQNLSPSPTLQTKTKTYTPTTSQQAESVVADSGYDGLDEVDVTVNAIPSQYKDTTDATATADKILQGYTAYANGQKLTGTASGGITPSGTISITQNGTVDVTQYASADVNVSGGGGKNTQFAFGIDFVKSSTGIESGQSIEVAKSGTYDVYWNAVRQATSGSYWTYLYIDGVQYGETQKAYIDNGNGQEVHFTGVTLTQGQTVSVRARSRTESYWIAVTGLTIIEA
jgi:hypothetical protein